MKTNLFSNLCCGGACLLAFVGTASAQLTNPNIVSYSPFIPQYPGGGVGIPLKTGGELFATGGDVTVTYLGYDGAAYYEGLYLDTPGGNGLNGTQLMENHTTPAGFTVDLGTFAAGTELLFSIYVNTTGNTWYDGPGSRNADGAVHANVVNGFSYLLSNGDSGSGTYVGFEDEAYDSYALNGGFFYDGDFNYGDLQFNFSGVKGVGVPDTSTTMFLLGLGLSGLAVLSHKLKK